MIKPKVRAKLQKGFADRLKKTLKQLAGAHVTVGVHEGAGDYEGGQSVVDVAMWNEYGTQDGRVPERSFIRSTVHAQEASIDAWRELALEKVMEGEWTASKALASIGLKLQIAIQNTIRSSVPPPNAPRTVASKEARGVAPRTLIDTGLLLRSISYQVILPGQGEKEHG